jgi:aminopeptidase N/puromycin-sensitive aminopeptidase
MIIRFRSCSARTALAAALAISCFAAVRPVNAQRLPTTVVPTHYTLTLTPDLKAATFSGVEKIDVNIKEPIKSITLNAAEIAFQSVTVDRNGAPQAAKVALDNDKEQATFTFPTALPAGKATLSIRYSGILNNELRGFYLSKTAKRSYAVTQFEPTDARRAFPCFDEPAFKAAFDVSLVVDSADTAISNGPIVSDTPGPTPGTHTLKFLTTPKMSTYLVAFLVGDFECKKDTQDNVDIRVCSTPDKVELTAYGVDVAKYVLHYYNDYFGIPYPLPKLDLIALPDFEAGAMENFGAITFRETDLLLDPNLASVTNKENVAEVIAHEMAHQWFGDLVTMKWWDNIWLNEGFATWMENKPVAALHPEWNIPLSVAADEQSTLNLDAQRTTRAIRAKANTPGEINQMFDGIAYGKASLVLLDMEDYLGRETFRKGVHAYLLAHEYGNATAEDFWNAQTEVSQKPVDKMMDSLITQPGEPLLTFGTPEAGTIPVHQSRFFLSPDIKPDPAQKWTLPVCLKTASLPGDCEILTPTTTSLRIPPMALFFANAGGRGYYRTAYPPQAYAAILAQVETDLTPAERISLTGDEWAQVQANKATAGDYLDLVTALKDDPNPEVIQNALVGVRDLYEQVASTPEERAALSAWIDDTFTPLYYKLGPASYYDTDSKRQLRAELMIISANYGKSKYVVAMAQHIGDLYLLHPANVDSTIGQAALTVAAQNGDAEWFDRLQNAYETTNYPLFQNSALRLLAQFQSPQLVARSLDYAASGKVRNQDAAAQFAIPLRKSETRDEAWAYIKANWSKVQAQVTTQMASRLIGATGDFCSVEARDDVKSFFTTHAMPASDVSLRHALEHIDGCIEFRSQQEPNLKTWLAAHPSK